jgi:hypothetical protein
VDTSRWVFVAQSHSQEDIVHATVSDVIRPDLVRDLLLQVSDVFTMLGAELALTSDARGPSWLPFQ